jgi:hypothetical protein
LRRLQAVLADEAVLLRLVRPLSSEEPREQDDLVREALAESIQVGRAEVVLVLVAVWVLGGEWAACWPVDLLSYCRPMGRLALPARHAQGRGRSAGIAPT